MTSFDVRELDELDAAAAVGLCTAYAYDDYRRYRRIAPAHALAHFGQRLLRTAASADARRLGAFDEASGELVGLLVLQHLEDDSALFGMRMAGIPFALVRAAHPLRRHVLQALLAELPQLVARERIAHVAFRVDTADIDAYQEFTSAGFRLVETLVTLTYDTERRGGGAVDPRAHGFDGAIRPVEARDVLAIEELAARAFTLNRYHLDEHLPKRDAGLLMARWAKSYCEQSFQAERDAGVWVAESAGGRLAGFLGHRLDRELQRHAGALVSGRALLAVADPRSGVGRMLSQHHVWTSVADYKDADTQLNNYGMIKVSFDLDMEMVRTKYTFHRWYGG